MHAYIGRLSPPSGYGHKNLALAVLHLACKDLSVEGTLLDWIQTEACEFWCEIATINYHEFCKNAKLLTT